MDNNEFIFDVTDLKLPIECLNQFASLIEQATKSYVQGNVDSYSGSIYSEYDRSHNFSIDTSIFTNGRIIRDIQDALGAVSGKGIVKLEFYLSSKSLEDYKCRLMFVEYGLGGYPVTVVLEKNIASEIKDETKVSSEYCICNSMQQFQNLLNLVYETKYLHDLLQSIITEVLVREDRKKNKKISEDCID